MKKLLLSVFVALSLASLSWGQTVVSYAYQSPQTIFTTVASGSGLRIIGLGAAFHQLSWNDQGTIATCQIQVDSSVDGVTWGNGDIIASTLCTSSGTATSTSHVVNFVRINITAISGAGAAVTALLTGYANNPTGGGGGVTNIATTAPIGGGPITTTGTITCTTCTTNAAALTSNALVKGGGGQAAAASAVATDDGTTLTYTGTGGVAATGTTGLTAGANGGAVGVVHIKGNTSGDATLSTTATASEILVGPTILRMPASSQIATSSGAMSVSATAALTLSPGTSVIFSPGGGIVTYNATANGSTMSNSVTCELITLNTAGTTTDSVGNLLPATSTIMGVTARITTTITTAANWQLGDATTAARFMASNSTLTAGTTAVGLQMLQGSVTTDAAGPVQAAAAKLRITTNVNPGAGAIRVCVFAKTFAAPTS